MKEQSVDDESLSTMFCLVESVINSRPLTTVSSDHKDLEPLTPNHLLLLRGDPVLPPGEFVKQDLYSCRCWRQVQYLADIFWRRWTREYLPTLQLRQKWRHPVKNLEAGDVVIVADDNAPRNLWHLGRVTETYPSSDGFVRTVKVTTRTSTLLRPVHKLCLLEPVSAWTHESQWRFTALLYYFCCLVIVFSNSCIVCYMEWRVQLICCQFLSTRW